MNNEFTALRQRVTALEIALMHGLRSARDAERMPQTLAWAQEYAEAPDDGTRFSRKEIDDLVGGTLRCVLEERRLFGIADPCPTQTPIDVFLNSSVRLFRADYVAKVVRSMEHHRVTWADYAAPDETKSDGA